MRFLRKLRTKPYSLAYFDFQCKSQSMNMMLNFERKHILRIVTRYTLISQFYDRISLEPGSTVGVREGKGKGPKKKIGERSEPNEGKHPFRSISHPFHSITPTEVPLVPGYD